MNAGTPPEPGKSRLTISTYRVTRDGRESGRTKEHTYHAGGAPDWLPDSLTWPPCRCYLCRSRRER
ncbi:hypothetical protein OEB94_09180 [Streptomyces sp. ICN988]|uniref:hypothetical protein n=1 Tax=Streptomyces sp. ICN988 TaxID=2983765 RepID=UPI0021E390AD|nr:hypothetical protein [Streptomyces sp. ICN988]MCV2459432.1 hypothetical protein [Streptomyces sp. ICN988]